MSNTAPLPAVPWAVPRFFPAAFLCSTLQSFALVFGSPRLLLSTFCLCFCRSSYYALRDRVGLNVKIKRLRVLFACIVYKNLQISLMASAYRNKHAFNVYRSCTRMRTATTASNLPPFDECRLSSCLPQKACQAIPTLVLLYGELGRGKSRQTTKKIKQGVMS